MVLQRPMALMLSVISIWLAVGCAPAPDELVVYSARKEHLIKPIFDEYTKATGTAVRFITDDAEPLTQRLLSEGENTPADMLLTVDAGNLWNAARLDLLRPVESAVLAGHVPSHLRDPEGRWFGLSVRARTIVYSTERVNPDSLSTYEALAEPHWAGRLCLRTAKKVYNQSLVAMMIAEHGEEETEQIVRGWVSNLATDEFANDTQVMEAILAGQCDIGIVNSYYFGRLQRDRPDLQLALFWSNQGDGGVHVNVSGAGVTRHAPHPDQATRLLEWLVSPRAQELFAGLNLEYPAYDEVQVAPLVAGWGDFEQCEINLALAGDLQADAKRLMDRAGYN